MSTTRAAHYTVPAGFPSRKIEWSRVAHSFLALLVTLTLTLVCQGHDRAGYHSGPHLTLLGGLPYSHSHPTSPISQPPPDADLDPLSFDALVSGSTGTTDMAGMDMSQHHMHSMLMPGSPAPPSAGADSPAGANIASVVSNSAEATGVSLLSFMLLISLFQGVSGMGVLELAGVLRRKSQISILAEPPPPRPAR
jgi:hypothetical protein